MPGHELAVFTIYEGAADVTLPFSVREWRVHPGWTEPARLWEAGSLVEARALVPGFADHVLPRAVGDEAHVVETWL